MQSDIRTKRMGEGRTTSEQHGESDSGMETCVHCQALTAEVDYCDRSDELACDRCLERPSECMVAPRRRLEELEDFLTDSDEITLAALKELAMERTRGELLADTRGFYDGSRANDLLLEATTDGATLGDLKESARQVAIGEREWLLTKLGGQEG